METIYHEIKVTEDYNVGILTSFKKGQLDMCILM